MGYLLLTCLSLYGCSSLEVHKSSSKAVLPTNASLEYQDQEDAQEQTLGEKKKSRMMWIWISPEQRRHMPKETAEYVVEEVRI